MSESPRVSSKPLPAGPTARRQPQLRIFQPSAHQLRLDFSGDVDRWSGPLLNAAEIAAESAPRADVLIDLGDVTALYTGALTTFGSIRRHTGSHGRSLTFIRVSEAAVRTFDRHRFEY